MAKPDSIPERSWGVTLFGTGDLQVAATAIKTACETVGMTCRRQEITSGVMHIEMVQEASWLQVLRHNLPQRAVAVGGHPLELTIGNAQRVAERPVGGDADVPTR